MLEIQRLMISSGRMAQIEEKIKVSLESSTAFRMGIVAGLDWVRDDLLGFDTKNQAEEEQQVTHE